MVEGARWGWKPEYTLQWHLSQGRGRSAQPRSLLKQELREVGLQGGGGLLEHADGELGGVSQALIVAVITDLAMRPPNGVGQALALAMSGEATTFSDKAEGAPRGQPSKPLRTLRLKGQQAVGGTDDHVVPLPDILHAS